MKNRRYRAAAIQTQSNPELDARIQSLQKNLDTLRLTYTELHPDIVSTKRLIKELEAQKKQDAKAIKHTGDGRALNPVYQQLTVAIAEADATVASLKARVDEYQSRLSQLKKAVDSTLDVETEYTQLTRDYGMYQQNYAAMLARSETASLSGEVESKTRRSGFSCDRSATRSAQAVLAKSPVADFAGTSGGDYLQVLWWPSWSVSCAARLPTDAYLRELTGLPLLGSVTRIETDAVKFKKRKGLIAYALSFFSLIGAYGILLTLQMFMAR